MFAVRFDPAKVVATSAVKETASILPLKRANSLDEESDSFQDDHEEVTEVDKDIILDTSANVYLEDGESGDASDKSMEVDLDDDGIEYNDEILAKKHTSVLSRFQQTINLQDRMSPGDLTTNELEMAAEPEQHPLEQIPQPAIVRTNSFAQTPGEHKSAAWINADKVHYDNSMSKPFSSYSEDLQPRLLHNIEKYFSTNSFPIQTALLDRMLPVLNVSMATTKKHLTRRVGDILVNASTGSGKTLGYSIPIVQLLSKRTVNRLRVLIVVPTKLLINQVYETISKLSQGTGLIISMAKLENSVKEEHKKFLQLEPDVLIVTPGRLVDHLQMKSVSLKNLMMLVLDEADHLLNQSFQNWFPELTNRIKADKTDQMPGNVIKMVFSATLTTNTGKLHGLQLYNPQLFMMDSIKLYNLPVRLQEYNIDIPSAKSSYKPLVLLRLLDRLTGAKILVFAKSNEASLRLASLLNIMIEKGLGKACDIASINSNNTRAQNKKMVNEFALSDKNLKNRVLITTDLMSRGIDIDDITEVINYDLPIASQQYIHRCGRTARAQSEGNAYNLLVGRGERKFWKQHIDEDISRGANGCAPRAWNENKTVQTWDIGGKEASQTQDPMMHVSEEEEEIYRKSLEILKEKANLK